MQRRFDIDLEGFQADPYPALAQMRAEAPVAYVPQLDAVLLTRRIDITTCEKRIDVFSSHQPDGLMSRLMGENMMRKDGPRHLAERKAMFPTISPRTARDHWTARFERAADDILDEIAPQGRGNLFDLYARRLSGEALKAICGLPQVAWQDIDHWSQAMIDGIANYKGDTGIQARCLAAVAAIDAAVDAAPDSCPYALTTSQRDGGTSLQAAKANIRLAISGGQNEPRDVIAGLAWALLTHPEQLDLVQSGRVSWGAAFDEYVRWISPIGMSPRRIAQDDEVAGVPLHKGQKAFLMFSSANRDDATFDAPDRFDIRRDASRHIAFGAGPHVCAGAPAARALVADVAMPRLFERLRNLSLDGPVTFDGWAFRGPLSLPCRWRT